MRIRIVSWNIENLSRHLASDKNGLPDIAHAFGDPDVLCLQEIRVRPKDEELLTLMRHALPGFDCHFALCDDPVNAKFRGGRSYGVATYVRQSLNALALPNPAWDREGRVVLTALPEQRIAIANVYAVNGTDKGYWDHALDFILVSRSLSDRISTAFIDASSQHHFQSDHASLGMTLED